MSADQMALELGRTATPVASRHIARSRNAMLAAGFEYMDAYDPRRIVLDARHVTTVHHMQVLTIRATGRILAARCTTPPGSDAAYTAIAAILVELDAQLAAVPDLMDSPLKSLNHQAYA